MPLQTWQIAFVCVEQAVIAALGASLLVVLGADVGIHGVVLVTSRIVLGLVSATFVYSVRKRQIYYVVVVASAAGLLLVGDAVWSCAWMQYTLKFLSVIMAMGLVTIMRKLAARLKSGFGTTGSNPQQLSLAQKTIFAIFAVTWCLMVAFPNNLVFPIAEFVAYFALIICAGKHLFTYLNASNEAFSAVATARTASLNLKKQAPSNPSRVASAKGFQQNFEAARRAKRNLGQNMFALFMLVLLMGPAIVLLSPIFQGNEISEIAACKQRSADDVSNAEAMRFYTYHIVDAMVIIGTCHAFFAFTAAQRRKRKMRLSRHSPKISSVITSKRSTNNAGLQTETAGLQPSAILEGSYHNASSHAVDSM
jgi:hypothetical protein